MNALTSIAAVTSAIAIALTLSGCLGGGTSFTADVDGGSSVRDAAPDGTTVRISSDGDSFDLTVSGSDWNADEEIAEYKSYNMAPDDGYHFVMAEVTITNNNDGTNKVYPGSAVKIEFVKDDGNTASESINMLPKEFDYKIEPGETATDNVAFLVPEGTESGVWRITVDGIEFYIEA